MTTRLITLFALALAVPAGAQNAEVSDTPPAPMETGPGDEASPPGDNSAVEEADAESGEGGGAADTGIDANAFPVRVAVYDFEVSDVDERLARLVTESVLIEVRKLQRVSAVGLDEIRAMLDHEANKQSLGCADESCLAEIADALGVDMLIIGTLAKVSNQHVFGMRLVDQRNAKVAAQVNRRFEAAGGEGFLAAVGPAVAELFPDRPLRPGTSRGVPKEVALKLNPPPLKPWMFWSTTAGAGALAMLTAVAATATLGTYAYTATLIVGSSKEPVSGSTLNLWTNVYVGGLIGTAIMSLTPVVAGAAAGVMYLFTDFDGIAEELEADE